MVEKASDGEGADAAFYRSDGGKVCTGVKFGGEVAFDNAVFAGCTCIYKSGAGGNEITRY